MSRINWDKDSLQKVLEMYNAKKTNRDIQMAFNTSKESVKYAIKQLTKTGFIISSTLNKKVNTHYFDWQDMPETALV